MDTLSSSLTSAEDDFKLGAILSSVFRLIKKFIKEIIIIGAVIYIPINVILEFVTKTSTNEMSIEYLKRYHQFDQVFDSLLGIIASISFIIIIQNFLETQEKMSWQVAIKKSVAIWPRVFTTQIVQTIFLSFLFLLLIVPGFIYSVYWALVVPIVVVLGKVNTDALNCSKKLVKGKWGKVFLFFCVFFALSLSLSLAVALVMELLFWFLSGYMVMGVVNGVLTDFIFIIPTVGSLLVFRHLQKEQESKVRIYPEE